MSDSIPCYGCMERRMHHDANGDEVCDWCRHAVECDAKDAELAALRARVAELGAKLKAVHDCLDRHRTCDPEEGCALFSDLSEIMEKP